MKKHLRSIAALLVMVFLAFGSTSGTSSAPSGKSAPKTPEEIRMEKVEKNFSFWDGSHDGLTKVIKKSMHNPSSYKHVETRFVDKGEYLIVTTEFRGTNAFGGVIKNSMTAKADLNGNIIEIITSLSRLSDLINAEVTPPKKISTPPPEETQSASPPIRKKYPPVRNLPPTGEGIAGPSREELGNEPNLQNAVKPPQIEDTLQNAVKPPKTIEDTFSGECVGVTDGDTISVMREGHALKIRLNGIDCPESSQAFGSKAKQFSSGLVFGKNVQVTPTDTDRYGRIVADVFTEDGKCLNRELVAAGLAWWYRQYSKDETLGALEETAREAKAGLWSESAPTPPWNFRHKQANDEPQTPARNPPKTSISDGENGATVYVTRTGSKYHRSGCHYLSKSKIPMGLDNAKQRYGPCSVCSPPR